MKLFIFCFIFCFSLSFSAFSNVKNFTLNSEKTLYIVDGDSISMQMRIAGIDAPEIRQQCQKIPNQQIDCGYLAKHYLKKTLKNLPKKLSIKPLGIDHYQRILVKVYKGDVDIGGYMVEQGMAFSYKDTYKNQEQLARKNRRGFWGFHLPPIQPYKWRNNNPKYLR